MHWTSGTRNQVVCISVVCGWLWKKLWQFPYFLESCLQGVHQDSPCGSSDKSVFLYSPMKAFIQNQRALAKVFIAQCCLIVPQPTLALAEWYAMAMLKKQLLSHQHALLFCFWGASSLPEWSEQLHCLNNHFHKLIWTTATSICAVISARRTCLEGPCTSRVIIYIPPIAFSIADNRLYSFLNSIYSPLFSVLKKYYMMGESPWQPLSCSSRYFLLLTVNSHNSHKNLGSETCENRDYYGFTSFCFVTGRLVLVVFLK